MRRVFNLLFACVVAPSVLVACEPDAGFFEPDGAISGVTGAGPTDAAVGLAPQSPAGPPFDYGPLLSTENTWSALYVDYFGPPQPADGGQVGGRASCAGNGNCHGTIAGGGYLSTGFLCADKEGCYGGITSQNSMNTIFLTPGDPLSKDLLYTGALRSVDHPLNQMPLAPPPGYPTAYSFTDVDIQRLAAWVDAGFPNN